MRVERYSSVAEMSLDFPVDVRNSSIPILYTRWRRRSVPGPVLLVEA